MSAWSAVGAADHVAVPAALSAALRAHVRDERFGMVTAIRGLPLGVRDALQTLFGSPTLDLAEPGAPTGRQLRRDSSGAAWRRAV